MDAGSVETWTAIVIGTGVLAGAGYRGLSWLYHVKVAVVGRPGRQVAGITLRPVAGIGQRLDDHDMALDGIRRQLSPDSGRSLHDVVSRMDRRLAQHCALPTGRAHPASVTAVPE